MDAVTIGPLAMPVRVVAALAAIVAANLAEDAAVIARYLDGEGLKLNNLLIDPTRALARATEVKGYPTTLFYDRHGKLVARHMGELSPAQLREQMEALR